MGGGYFYKQLNKDVKEINKIFISLFSTGIILIAIFIGISITKTSYALFSDTIKGEKTIEVVVDNQLNKTTVFNYTGEEQSYMVSRTGYYYIELAGGAGGARETSLISEIRKGLGAKTSGYIYLKKGEILYFYVGKKGTNENTSCRNTGYEYNGGGIAKPAKTGICGPTGGGATDVRLVNGSWDDEASLISRIMVAAGGGGANNANSEFIGGHGGTLYGVTPIGPSYTSYLGHGGSQTVGGTAPTKYSSAQSNGTAGSFGKGGYGGANVSSASTGGGAGGGGGYYGGSGASGYSSGVLAAGGGSSYISGYAGVNSIEENTTITHTNQTLHYSGKYFIGGKMEEGQNEGNGYAMITYVGTKPERKNTELNNVRYIKNCGNYNSMNNYNHWREIQAIVDGVNIAKGKTITGTVDDNYLVYENALDGDLTTYASTVYGTSDSCVTVDLGDTYDLDEILVLKANLGNAIYYDNIISVSSDNSSFTEIIDEESVASFNGYRMNAYTDTLNGYVSDGLVLWYDGISNSGTTHSNSVTSWENLAGPTGNATISGAHWTSHFLSFDGTNDYARFTNPLYDKVGGTPNITTEINFHQTEELYSGIIDMSGAVNEYTGQMRIWSKPTTGDYQFAVTISQNTANDKPNYAYRASKEEYPINNRYFTVFGKGDERAFVYIDGEEKYSEIYNTSDLYGWDRSTAYLGRSPDVNGSTWYYLKGYIYNVRIYNRELTEEEMLQNKLVDEYRYKWF